jgi:uncharacterized protein (DUF1015 family)
MAELHPFRAYRYNQHRVDLGNVLTQPYDKITPQMQERYYAASPYNLISVEKGVSYSGDTPDNNVYTRAGRNLKDWISEGILEQDGTPAYYVYSQDFTLPGGSGRLVRTGLIGLGRIEDYDAGVVFRHEKTLAAPKADRLELLRRTRTQTGQLFMLYDEPTGETDGILDSVRATRADAVLRDEYGVVHQLWKVTDEAPLNRLAAALADKKVVIADGHHRYETALTYRNESRAGTNSRDKNAPYEFAMMTLFNAQSKNLKILPTHRVVANLPEFDFNRFRSAAHAHFDWYGYPFADSAERVKSYQTFRKDLETRGTARHTIGLYPGGNAFYLFVLRKDADLDALLPDVPAAVRELDVILLHRLLLEKCLGITAEAVTAESHITYEREMDAAIGAVDRKEAQLACLLNPVRVREVMEIAIAGDVLPQKSTDFYPKLLSGIAIYRY